MTEHEARTKLRELLDRHYAVGPNFSESNLPGGYIEFHIAKIRREGGNDWNEQVAEEYLNSLASETP